MQSTQSFPLLPSPLWPRVVALDRVLSMGQIEQTVCKLMLNCDCYIAILETIWLCAKSALACLRMLSTKWVYKALNDLQWLICHKTKPNHRIALCFHSITYARRGKLKFSWFVIIFFIKTCFSIYITHSPVNFTWSALHNCQKFDDRPLFNPRTLCLICYQFE